MSVTQGYIVGQPALTPAERPEATPPRVHEVERDARVRAVGPAGLYPTSNGVRPLALPAWVSRQSAGAWVADYLRSLRTLARAIPRFASLTITYRPGISFFDQVAPVLLLARFYGIPTVLRYRSSKTETELEDYGRGALPLLHMADRIEVSCGHLARTFGRYGLAATVVPDRVDGELFRARRIETVQPRIIMTRRLIRGNGLTGAVKAFQLVKMKYPRAELIIAGDGPLRPWLERFVALERIFGVTFTGQVDHAEISRLMAGADVYLNNATIDGLPTSMLEAMASGLCVVSTPVGDIPRMIRDGRNGLLVPVNDFASLADRIIELVETPPLCAHLSRCAARTVASLVTRPTPPPRV